MPIKTQNTKAKSAPCNSAINHFAQQNSFWIFINYLLRIFNKWQISHNCVAISHKKCNISVTHLIIITSIVFRLAIFQTNLLFKKPVLHKNKVSPNKNLENFCLRDTLFFKLKHPGQIAYHIWSQFWMNWGAENIPPLLKNRFQVF